MYDYARHHLAWWESRTLSDSSRDKTIKDSTMYQIWSQWRQNIISFTSSHEDYELYLADNFRGQVAAEDGIRNLNIQAQNLEAYIRDCKYYPIAN